LETCYIIFGEGVKGGAVVKIDIFVFCNLWMTPLCFQVGPDISSGVRVIGQPLYSSLDSAAVEKTAAGKKHGVL